MKYTKKSLHAKKEIRAIRRLFPIKNSDFIETCKKQVVDRFGPDALSELIITDKSVSFRESSVPLVDDTICIEELEGVVHFKSKDYNFKSGIISSWGEISAKNLTEFGWILECFNGSRYEYHVLN